MPATTPPAIFAVLDEAEESGLRVGCSTPADVTVVETDPSDRADAKFCQGAGISRPHARWGKHTQHFHTWRAGEAPAPLGSSSNVAASDAAHAAVRAPDVDALFAAAMTPDAADAEESSEARENMDEFGVAAITEACGLRGTQR